MSTSILALMNPAIRAELLRLGIIDASGNYTPGGGASVESWDAEVTSLPALNAALVAGARVLITQDILIADSSQVNLPTSGDVTIGFAPGVGVARLGSTGGLFDLASGTCKLRIVSSNDPESDPMVETVNGSLFSSAGNLTVEAERLHFSTGGSCTPFASNNIVLSIRNLIVEAANSALTISGKGSIGHATIRTGGSSASIIVGCHIAHLEVASTVRAYTTNNSATTFAIRVGTVTSGGLARVDAISGAGLIAGTLVLADYVSSIGRVSTLGRIAAGANSVIENGGLVTHVVIPSTVRSGTIRNTYIDDGLVYETSAGPVVLENCAIEGANTAISGSRTILRGGRIVSGHSLTAASGSKIIADGVEVAGTLTLDSGAAARCVNLVGSGTLTNNDPLSIVTLSENAAWDNTPATARFDSTVLDPIRHQLVFDFPGVTEGEPNRAPSQRAAGCIGRTTSSGASMDSGYYVSSTTGQFEGQIAFSAPSRLGFTLAFWWRPTATSTGGAEQNVLNLSATDGAFIAVNQIDNNLRVYLGSVGFYDTSTAGNLFSTSVARLVTINVRLNGSTPTMYVRVNGTQVIAAASAPLLPSFYTRLILGGSGSDARAGRFTKIQAWNIGLTNTQADELLNKPLLSGVA